MYKNALFFGKILEKIAEALRDPPPNPRWPPAAEGSIIITFSYAPTMQTQLTVEKEQQYSTKEVFCFCFFSYFLFQTQQF